MKMLSPLVPLFAVTLLATSAIAQGVFYQGPPIEAYGQVFKITEQGPPLKLEATEIQVKFSVGSYRATADSGHLFKPVSGEVSAVTIGDYDVELASTDISGGMLDTKSFGKLALFVIPNMSGPDQWVIAATDEQLKKIEATIKKDTVE